jgi:Cys-tRNA(Pro) deacylase
MSKQEIPITSAIRFLRQKEIKFIPHFYNYEEHGGTKVASTILRVPEHNVVKTIVMETDTKHPLIILMHGDYEVSTKQFARTIGVKQVEPCDQKEAERHTGYLFGGTSPFGTRKQLPIYIEKTIFDLEKIYVNGGKRGFLIEITPHDLKMAFSIVEVNVAIKI